MNNEIFQVQFNECGKAMQCHHEFLERIASMTPGILFVYDLDEHRNVIL